MRCSIYNRCNEYFLFKLVSHVLQLVWALGNFRGQQQRRYFNCGLGFCGPQCLSFWWLKLLELLYLNPRIPWLNRAAVPKTRYSSRGFLIGFRISEAIQPVVDSCFGSISRRQVLSVFRLFMLAGVLHFQWGWTKWTWCLKFVYLVVQK